MTQKELLYFEDALSHEKNLIDILNCNLSCCEDESIKSFLENEIKVHEKIRCNLLKLLKGCCDE